MEFLGCVILSGEKKTLKKEETKIRGISPQRPQTKKLKRTICSLVWRIHCGHPPIRGTGPARSYPWWDDKKLKKKELKLLVRWISKNFPDTSVDEICTTEFWDSLGIKSYNLSIKRNPVALCMLSIFCIILETLHQQAECQLLSSSVSLDPKPSLEPSPRGPLKAIQNGTGPHQFRA